MAKTLKQFYEDLGARESGGNYKSKNKYGYVGKYQMGEAALADAGYYKKASGKFNNDWTGKFTGKDGTHSLNDFLNNKQAQENAQTAYKEKQWSYLKNLGADKYVGKTVNGVKITESGLLAGAHLKGAGSVMQYLKSNGKDIGKDAFGTSVESYIKKFGGYDVSNITHESKNGKTTGYATNVEAKRIFTQEEIGNMTPEEFKENENEIFNQLKDGLITSDKDTNKKDFSDFKNPELGTNKIFTREEIGNMTTEEFQKNEKAIEYQMKTIGVPTKAQAETKTKSNSGSSSKASGGSSSSDGNWVTTRILP